MPARRWILALATTSIACVACAARPDDDVGEEVAPIVSSRVSVVGGAPGDEVRVEPERLVFRRTGHEDLLARRAGDVLASADGDGFLRRVRGVRAEGDDLVVDTEPAGLGDALQQGRVRQRFVGTTDPSSVGVQGGFGSLLQVPLAGRLTMGSTGSIDVTEGHLAFDPDVDVDLAVKNGSVERARFIVSGKADASLHARFDIRRPSHVVDGGFVRLNEPGWTLASAPPVRRVVFVGWLPVLVVLRLDVLLEYAVEISGDVSGDLDLGAATTLRGGIELRDGRWRTVGEGTFSLAHDNQLVVSRRVLGGDLVLSTRLSVQLYDVAGPYVTLDAYGGAAQSTSGDASSWYARAGVRSRAGVEANVFGPVVLGYQAALFDRSVRVPLLSPP